MENDDRYSEYIDNEELCTIEGIPCKYGIPCCSQCTNVDIFETKYGKVKE